MAGSEQLTIPSISVIVPCYNQGEYLAEALDSVLAQTYQNWECVIVNDGSNDNTEDVATEYCKKDNRFHYLTKENGGLSSARNAGIQQSKGEFILPLDADDLIAPQYIEKALEVFEDKNGLTLVYCKAKKFGYENADWELPSYLFEELLLSNPIFCSAIYRKSTWRYAKGYDEDMKKGLEDWAFWIKILEPKSMVYQLQQVLFYYRVRQCSMINTMTYEDYEIVKWQIFNKNLKTYQSQFNSPISIIIDNKYQRKLSNEILNSYSYKIGNFLLTPFSILKILIKRLL
ncbi:glycosyltransferase family 2 protein [Mucilaginibacter sp. SP1R1]|uniref:glycosyltransferase family 2 protein n=1 Tax=Mucilaginibacter sp. SP1R1 TaxID=2723091 RepID=UPI00161EA1F7|nr:glycosyltransferase family A protein [Mucilaginibacter sp. SP1R1]MBB6151001.1 glycosyltransferase involved in cell wall biosynthesis [Mucilaginibacter sp. SP1R1]